MSAEICRDRRCNCQSATAYRAGVEEMRATARRLANERAYEIAHTPGSQMVDGTVEMRRFAASLDGAS